jgi:hypothetical protein
VRHQTYQPEQDIIDRQIYNVSREYKISILPIYPNFEIDNLYPLTDHVELWNIFIIGNDKTYILANVNDPHIQIPKSQDLSNNHSEDVIPTELHAVFDAIWTKTLLGRKLQFYMVWNGKLYFINTYPFLNGKNKVIGGIMFMRAFDTMPEVGFTSLEGYLIPRRRSQDIPISSQDIPRSPRSPNRNNPGAFHKRSMNQTQTTILEKESPPSPNLPYLPQRRTASQPTLGPNLHVIIAQEENRKSPNNPQQFQDI